MSRDIRVKISVGPLTLEISGEHSDYVPATMYDASGDPGHPSEGGGLEDIGVTLVAPYENDASKRTRIDITKVLEEVGAMDYIESLLLEQIECEEDMDSALEEDDYEERQEHNFPIDSQEGDK
jgi:hypothetical protein